MLDQFLKTGGSAKFFGNRTIPSNDPLQGGINKSGQVNGINGAGLYVYQYQKVDVPIVRGHTLRTTGGYVIFANTCAMAYSGIDAAVGPVGTGSAAWAEFYFNELNDTQLLSFSAIPTAGDFQLTFDGQNTTAIPFTATHETVQAALMALSNVGTLNVTVTGSFAGGFIVTFLGALANADQPQMTILSNTLTSGGAVTITPSTIQDGLAPGLFILNDTITIGTYTVTLKTDSSAIGPNELNIDSVNLQNQITEIFNFLNGLTVVTDHFTLVQSGNSLTFYGRFLDSTLDPTIFSVISSNPNVFTDTSIGQTHNLPGQFHPWIGCDMMRNVFIISPRRMFGSQGTSVTPEQFSLEEFLYNNATLYNSQHALQLTSDSRYKTGFYLRKNVAKTALLRIPSSGELYGSFELAAATAGVAGNLLNLTIVENPQVHIVGGFLPMFTVVGNDITLTLGTDAYTIYDPLMDTTPITTFQGLQDALNRSSQEVKNLITVSAFKKYNQSEPPAITGPMAQTFFSGGSVAGSDLTRNVMLDLRIGGILNTDYGYAYPPAEIQEDGTSRVIFNQPAFSYSRYGCLIARYLPASTPIAAYLRLEDLWYTAKTAGVGGNSITIQYTPGGTAGAEVVTVIGSAIAIQIEDLVSTVTQILAAVQASVVASALVSVKLVGLPANIATIMITASSLQGGSVGYPTASGYAIVHRSGGQSSGIKSWDAYWTSDFDTPASYFYCGSIQENISLDPPPYNINPNFNKTPEVRIFEIKDDYDLSGNYLRINLLNADATGLEGSISLPVQTSASLIYDSGATLWTAATPGFSGDLITIQLATHLSIVPDVVVTGTAIVVHIQDGVNTVADIQTAILASPAASALVSVAPAPGFILSSPVTTDLRIINLVGGMETRFYDGMYGFGYVSLDAKFYAINFDTVDPAHTIKIPYANKDYLVVESFRLTDLN